MKDVKIVIGANYGDEGKGLLTRHFTLDALKRGENPVIIFHNGTAQRGHTVDFGNFDRHVFHHFGSGSADGAATFFANTFWVHPMEFHREYVELVTEGRKLPMAKCDANAKVVTIFDMLADHITMDYIAAQAGEREYGTCGYGTWCATDIEHSGAQPLLVKDLFLPPEELTKKLRVHWGRCLNLLTAVRKVDFDKVPKWQFFNDFNSLGMTNARNNYINDVKFFLMRIEMATFDDVYKAYDSIIFENGQGLGIDRDNGEEWHTTSYTGLANPVAMLGAKNDFSAEAVYVTRSYDTRHGIGRMGDETHKTAINRDMFDRTNVYNEFQGNIRFGFFDSGDMCHRVYKDMITNNILGDTRYECSFALTHTNEFDCEWDGAKYISDNPFNVEERR